MITYKYLFDILRDPENFSLKFVPVFARTRTLQMIQILIHAEIAVFDPVTRKLSLHPKQIKPTLPIVVADIAPTPPVLDAPRRVHVNWSGRGFSSGSYAVKADNGKFLTIVMELDVEREMKVSRERTKAA